MGILYRNLDGTTREQFFIGKRGSSPSLKKISSTELDLVNSSDAILMLKHSPKRPIVTKTSAYTLTDNDDCVLCNSASAFAISLPTAANRAGKTFILKNINIGIITVTPNGAETIDVLATWLLYNCDWIELISDGSNWRVINTWRLKTWYDIYLVSQSTTSVSLVNYRSWVTPSIPAGVYVLDFAFLWAQVIGNSNSQFQITIDGSAIWDAYQRIPNAGGSTYRYPDAGFYRTTFATTSTHTINLDYAAAAGTTYIHESRMKIAPVYSV